MTCTCFDEDGPPCVVHGVLDKTPAAPVAAHPLVGKFGLMTSREAERLRYGWNWERQIHILAVMDDVALVQNFECAMGEPSDQTVVPLTELLSGEWRYFNTAQEWRDYGQRAMDNYWTCSMRMEPFYGLPPFGEPK